MPEQELKEVRIELPVISVTCPHCQTEDDCAGHAFTPSEDSYVFGEAKFFCDHCEMWSLIILV